MVLLSGTRATVDAVDFEIGFVARVEACSADPQVLPCVGVNEGTKGSDKNQAREQHRRSRRLPGPGDTSLIVRPQQLGCVDGAAGVQHPPARAQQRCTL